MITTCKVIGDYELRQYSGYLSPNFEGKNRFIILEKGVYLHDEHFNLKDAHREL